MYYRLHDISSAVFNSMTDKTVSSLLYSLQLCYMNAVNTE